MKSLTSENTLAAHPHQGGERRGAWKVQARETVTIY